MLAFKITQLWVFSYFDISLIFVLLMLMSYIYFQSLFVCIFHFLTYGYFNIFDSCWQLLKDVDSCQNTSLHFLDVCLSLGWCPICICKLYLCLNSLPQHFPDLVQHSTSMWLCHLESWRPCGAQLTGIIDTANEFILNCY